MSRRCDYSAAIGGLALGLGIGALLLLALALVARPWRWLPSAPSVPPTAGAETAVSSPPTAGAVASRPSPQPTAMQTPTPIFYTVLEGDTLSGIAYRFGITVEGLRAANGIVGDLIYPGQVLLIPLPASPGGSAPAAAWEPSILEGDLASAYPATLETPRFTLHFTPGTLPAEHAEEIAAMVTQGLEHIEGLLGAHLEGRFDVYAAGRPFAPPDQALRGRSFSAVRRTFFLYDGTGNPADRQYILTHELAHLFTWNVFGPPVSAMLSEGVAVYAGMTLIAQSNHLPLEAFCVAYQRAGVLPRVSAALAFRGHARDLPNYHAAGCFVKHLLETYGAQEFARLYPSGDYVGVYGVSLTALEEQWIAYLEALDVRVSAEPLQLVEAVAAVGEAYEALFAGFNGSPAQMSAYHEVDAARLALLEGRLQSVEPHLTAFRQAMGW